MCLRLAAGTAPFCACLCLGRQHVLKEVHELLRRGERCRLCQVSLRLGGPPHGIRAVREPPRRRRVQVRGARAVRQPLAHHVLGVFFLPHFRVSEMVVG